ncbi:MAG: sugar O-acyltransferase (sialic acid O-acetyltransferase NeuD family) [Rhodothermales bacterium]|jgi:sugar O-acyltransferase (sialic acid O-acetyltransferase NeuD family)
MPISIVGAGGHAKAIIAAAEASSQRVVSLYDDRFPCEAVCGVAVVGTIADGFSTNGHLIIGLGNNKLRAILAADRQQGPWGNAQHLHSVLHSSVQVGVGTVILAGAVLQPDTIIGTHCIINTGATVDHDCQLGDYVHVGPGAVLAGGVKVESGAMIGAGAVVCPGLTIGAWARIGAGGVVVKDCLEGATYVGVPAKRVE